MKIFILEDDNDQAELIKLWLTEFDHECLVFHNGREFIKELPYHDPDVLLIDWNLPVLSGMEVMRWVKSSEFDRTPILFITTRNTEDDVIKALNEGADDYLIKPITQGELNARIAAVVRRSPHHKEKSKDESTKPYVFDDPENTVEFNDESVKLTIKEYSLAKYFFQSEGRLVSRNHLLETIWTKNSIISTRTVDTHISRLRKKLKLDGSFGWKLVSVYHQGYKLVKD